MPWAVYAKRTELIRTPNGKIIEPDKMFMPIDEKGIRVSKNKLTNVFAEKADAQEWIATHEFKNGVAVEVRKV